jgi:hypothetical protein
MNKDLENFDTKLWNNFFNFIYPDEENMTQAEVRAELQRSNIDIRSAMSKLNMALATFHEKQKAQAELKTARGKRLSLLEKFKQIKMPSLPDLRNELQHTITQHLNTAQQPVYFRKLEEAASEQDLKTLLEDILLLESLDRDTKNDE